MSNEPEPEAQGSELDEGQVGRGGLLVARGTARNCLSLPFSCSIWFLSRYNSQSSASGSLWVGLDGITGTLAGHRRAVGPAAPSRRRSPCRRSGSACPGPSPRPEGPYLVRLVRA